MKILCIFPHPDDETIFTGGTILRHAQNGDEVVWVCASHGERGGMSSRRSSKFFYVIFSLLGKFRFLFFGQALSVWWLSLFRRGDRKLKKKRASEGEKVSKILGIRKLIFLGIEDMRFGWYKKTLVAKIKRLIKTEKPDVVYTLHKNGITGHPDHIVLSKCVTRAVNESEKERPVLLYATFSREFSENYSLPLLGFPEDKMSKIVILSAEELYLKHRAIRVYRSQQYLWDVFLKKYPELIKKEYFIKS